MPSINLLKLTAGLESTAGSAVSRTAVIPISGLFNVQRSQEVAADPAIVGANMKTGSFLLADSVGGDIPLTPRPVDGYGRLLVSCLGATDTATQIGGCLRFQYTGASASNKVSASASGDTINSKIGTLGSEANDSNFGSSGTIDLNAGATDTLAELVAVINAYSDYTCEKVFGADSLDVAAIEDITALQGKKTWVYVWFTSSSTGLYRHNFAVNLTSTERKTLTLQGDGLQDNYTWDGAVVDTMSFSAALKGFAEGSCTVMGFDEGTGITASTVTLPTANPLVFHDGSFYLGSTNYTYLRNLSFEIRNNHNADGYGQGSTGRQYHEKGLFEVSGDVQLRLDATSIAERAKIFANTDIAIAAHFNGAALSADIDEMLIVEIPYVSLDEWTHSDNAGQVDATVNWSANNPKGSPYNSPFKMWMINDDSQAYSS